MTTDSRPDRAGALLEVDGLTVSVTMKGKELEALSSVTLSIGSGEIVGVVGESGCGKTMLALSIMGLLGGNAAVTGGRIVLDGQEISKLSERSLRRIRGCRMSMIFQEPMVALNPLMRVGQQVREVLAVHGIGKRSQRLHKVDELFALLGLTGKVRRTRQYPHELSGGMRQRVMIAMALAGEPSLLIADEPTTALDATVQAQILDQILQIRDRLGTAVLFVTHDMGVIAEIADRVVVMYAGQVVEVATVYELFSRPSHHYTRGLLASVSVPILAGPDEELPTIAGRVPALGEIPSGCAFAPRCPMAQDICSRERPALTESESSHQVACWFPWSDPDGGLGAPSGKILGEEE